MNNKYVLVRENGEQWINSPNNGGECCETKFETVAELNRLLDHIKRLEERGDWLSTRVGWGEREQWIKAKEAKP